MSESETAAPKILVKNFIDPVQLQKDLTYSTANLTGAMVDQASLYAHYGQIHAQAAAQVDAIELRLEVVQAQIARELRDEAAKASVKITVAEIDAGVLTSERIIALRKAVNTAKQIEANAKTAVEAFRHRKDMLVQLGAGERVEKEGELRMGVKKAALDIVRNSN